MRKYRVIVNTLLILFLIVLSHNGYTQVTKLKDIVGKGPNGRYADDRFGVEVAIDGDIIVVGANQHSYDSNEARYSRAAGAVFVFYRDEGGKDNWGLKKKIVASGSNGRKGLDLFGHSVAVYDDIIVVGSLQHEYDENGNNKVDDAGAVYIYYRDEGGKDNWGQKAKIVADGGRFRPKDGIFGSSVAISQNILAVCTVNKSSVGDTTVGNVFIYYKDEGGIDNWGFKTKLKNSNGLPFDGKGGFGSSVAIQNDIVVVGAIKEAYDENNSNYAPNAGAAYIFQKNEGGVDNWGLKKKIVAKGKNARNAIDRFGYSVAISQNIIAVGANEHDFDESGENFESNAGAVYIYYKDEGGIDNWGQKVKVVAKGTNGRGFWDGFGTSVSLFNDILIVGSINNSFDVVGNNEVERAGAAFVYSKKNGGIDNWGYEAKLVGSGNNGRKPRDRFGWSVAVSNRTIVVGTPFQSYDTDGTDSLRWSGKASIFRVDFTSNILESHKDNDINVATEGKNIHLSFTDNNDYSITVYDLMGREIAETQTKGRLKNIIRLPHVAMGYYLVKIQCESGQQVFKTYLQ